MPQNVKLQGTLQCAAISLLTLFGTIKPAQQGPPYMNSQSGRALVWEGNSLEAQGNCQVQCAWLPGEGRRAVIGRDLAENTEMSGAEP